MKDRTDVIARNCECDGYQIALQSMVYKFFDKKTGSGSIAIRKSGVSANEQLAEELNKAVIKKFKRRKVRARFKDNIWAADLAEMESMESQPSNNKNVKYLFSPNKLWVDQGK